LADPRRAGFSDETAVETGQGFPEGRQVYRHASSVKAEAPVVKLEKPAAYAIRMGGSGKTPGPRKLGPDGRVYTYR